MCIILFSIKPNSQYQLVLASNRDEYYNRITAKASPWNNECIIGGLDLSKQIMGTWLVITYDGRLGAITNNIVNPGGTFKTSRGTLVTDYLRGKINPLNYLTEIDNHKNDYDGFNLLLGNYNELWCYSNKEINFAYSQIEPKRVYGLSNNFLDVPWWKVTTSKNRMTNLFKSEVDQSLMEESLFNMLMDKTKPPVNENAIFVEDTINNYSTKSSTIILIDNNLNCTFIERTYQGQSYDDIKFTWNIDDYLK